jgi:hypothetical protein
VEETGWFPRSSPQIPKIGPLEDIPPGGIAVSSHQPIPDRIYTGRGVVYIVAFKESQPADMERFDEEKKAFRERMLAEKRQRALQKFLEVLKAKAQIEVHPQFLDGQGA